MRFPPPEKEKERDELVLSLAETLRQRLRREKRCRKDTRLGFTQLFDLLVVERRMEFELEEDRKWLKREIGYALHEQRRPLWSTSLLLADIEPHWQAAAEAAGWKLAPSQRLLF